MYANDTIILCDSEQNMEQALISIYGYCSNWKLKVNCNRIRIVLFSRNKVRASNCMFQFGKEKIEIVSEYKYRGILFSYDAMMIDLGKNSWN